MLVSLFIYLYESFFMGKVKGLATHSEETLNNEVRSVIFNNQRHIIH